MGNETRPRTLTNLNLPAFHHSSSHNSSRTSINQTNRQGPTVKLLIATNTAHKLKEIREILSGSDIVLQSLLDRPDLPEPPEDGLTFEANALQKARTIQSQVGGVVLADDSGLEVDALGGAPGVHSKRFSAEGTAASNNQLLLDRMADVTLRTARFRCVLALVSPHYEGTVDGGCEGQIATGTTGTQGFGYDPLFVPAELDGRTMAEASMQEKNAISHRGRAFRRLSELLDAAAAAERAR